MLPHLLFCQSWEFEGLANACVNSQNLDAVLREPCSYYGFASAPKSPQKHSQIIWFPNISWGSMLPDPHTIVLHAYAQIRHSCNPLSKNLGYGLTLCHGFSVSHSQKGSLPMKGTFDWLDSSMKSQAATFLWVVTRWGHSLLLKETPHCWNWLNDQTRFQWLFFTVMLAIFISN